MSRGLVDGRSHRWREAPRVRVPPRAQRRGAGTARGPRAAGAGIDAPALPAQPLAVQQRGPSLLDRRERIRELDRPRPARLGITGLHQRFATRQQGETDWMLGATRPGPEAFELLSDLVGAVGAHGGLHGVRHAESEGQGVVLQACRRDHPQELIERLTGPAVTQMQQRQRVLGVLLDRDCAALGHPRV